MSLRLAHRISWLLALLPAFGCGSKDLRTVITEHKAKVEPQLAKLTPIRDAARKAPPVTHDDVVLNGPSPHLATTELNGRVNVALEYLEDLDDLPSWGAIPLRILGSGSMNRCASTLATHREPYNALLGTVPDEVPWYTAQSTFEHCEAVRYVFVIRSLAYSAPSETRQSSGSCPNPEAAALFDGGIPDAAVAALEAAAATHCTVFDGGYLQAEVLVFDIRNAAQLGGFRFTAESSPRVDVAGVSDKTYTLVHDFSNKIRSAFTAAAEKHVASLTVGY